MFGFISAPQPASVSDITQESPSSSGPKPAAAKYLLQVFFTFRFNL